MRVHASMHDTVLGERNMIWFQNLSVGYLVNGYMYVLREMNLWHLVLEAEKREATGSWKHQLSHGGDTSESVLNNQSHDAVWKRESAHVCVGVSVSECVCTCVHVCVCV